MYLSTEQKLRLGKKYEHFLNGYVYIECLTHGISKPPIVEIGPDKDAFFDARGNRIHIGVGAIEAKNEKDFYDQAFFLLGHELQHMLSTTQKDWEAALKMCHREACQRLSVKVFGRVRRLSKDSDYEAFFRELADKDIYVNQQMLMSFAHFVCNSLEDGRIENIRQVKHPGFGDYRRIWNGKHWLKDDVASAPFFEEDPNKLTAYAELATILNQLLSLSLHGVYQKDFLAAYEGTKLHRRVESYIPDIARAVLSKTCKGCMDQARSLFMRLLDLLLDVCTCEMTAQQIEQLIKDLLDKLLNEAGNAQMSANPNTEEQGEGIPAPSMFGQSDLEIEVTQEEYDEMMKDADEDDSTTPGIKIKVKDEDEADEAEKADGKDSSADGSSAEADKNAENSPSAPENTGGDEGDKGEGDGEGESQSPSEKSGESRKEDKSEGGKEENGTSAGNEGESIDSPSDQTEEGNSSADGIAADNADTKASVNNRTDEGSTKDKSSQNLEEEIRAAMEKAAENVKTDFDFAEADAKADEKFREAAANFKAVNPAEVNMTPVNSHYDYDVEFIEATRVYAPTLRLPLELENKGKSLDRAVDQLIKNKQDPDLRFLRSGKLDTRRIANLAMGDINVFKKPGEPVRSDVAGYLLMDNSGSMGNGPGSTRFACCNAFAVLEEGFKNHMPIKIAAFDAWGNEQVSHEVIKEFAEVSEANLSYNFRDLGRSGNGNKDGYSIRVATQQLLQRDEKDKILIIASDGFPTEYYGGHSEGCADVKSAVEDARKAGIRTIGMYMYHEQNESDFATFQDMYGPEIIFASLDEIEDELVRILKRYF